MNTLSAEQIAELRKMEAEATPGPWHAVIDCIGFAVVIPDSELHRVPDVRDWIFQALKEFAAPVDHAFVAALRNAAPALLDAAERCANAESKDSIKTREINTLTAEVRKLEATVAAREAEIDKLRGGIGTHSLNCHTFGWRHYACAEAKIKELEAALAKEKAK